jgi:putative transposase
MQSHEALAADRFYHIFNRGNNREDLFRADKDYRRFLTLYAHHIAPVAETYAYCLMRNHFHVLVKVRPSAALDHDPDRTPAQFRAKLDPSRGFSNLFNAYAKHFNYAYDRSGSLFEERFKRIHVDSERYLTHLIAYIHRNPEKHGFVPDFREWPWSSYNSMLATRPTRLRREEVMEWFGSAEIYKEFHSRTAGERVMRALIADDFS